MSYYASIDGVIELRAGVDPEVLAERIKDFAEFVESEVASSDRSVTLYLGGYEKYCEDSIYAFLEEVSTKTISGEINYTGEDFEHWRHYFDQSRHQWREQHGHIEYEKEGRSISELIEIGNARSAAINELFQEGEAR